MSFITSDNDNKLIEIEARGLSSDGSGVGRDETGITTFVPGLLPGEIGLVNIIERKKNWQRGELKKIIKSSQDRISPPCSVFGACGGCQLQHLRYEETLKWKKIWVEEALRRIGKLNLDAIKVHPTIGMENPWRYRNKARLHIDNEGRIGYYQQKTNNSVVFNDCLLISERMNGWIESAKDNIFQLNKDVVGCDLTWRENKKGEGILIIERSSGRAGGKGYKIFEPEGRFELKGEAPKLGESNANDNQNKVAYLTENIMGIQFRVSPLSFLQVNSVQTETLYSKAIEFSALTGDETVWDLYCGIGTMTLHFARQAREVIGIEENPFAVRDA
ncbi:MAG TPA: TRAM domain-containing protein, partial [Clostridia bacterium]